MSALWTGLVADALLGTERRPVTVPRPPGPLGDTLGRLDPTDGEGALLAAAAAVSLWRRAGRRAATDPGPLPEACPPDGAARVGEAAGERLAGLLEGEHRRVLAEWLELVAAAGRRAPEEHLPALLDLGTRRPELRLAVVAVAGRRGPWLGVRNPAWAWAAGTADADDWARGTWATGAPDARRLLLDHLRATDPDRGRELVESTWPTESAEDRAAFLAALASNLSMADEPFLEGALDDRRKEVRRAAAGLLACLPTSRLARRMAERARSLLRVEGRRRPRLVVSLPTEVDRAAVRDGIDAGAAGGERARWLTQIVAATPLDTWTEAFGADPPALLRLAEGSDHAADLMAGWTTAAARQRHRAWAAALVERVDDPALVVALDDADAEATVARRMSLTGLATPSTLAMLLNLRAPWSRALSLEVAATLAADTARPASQPGAHRLRQSLPELAVRLDPSVVHEAEGRLADADAWWAPSVRALLELLSFRLEMAEEIFGEVA